MEYIPELEAKLSPPVQREGMLIQTSNMNTSTVRTINITRRVLNSPEATNSLRPSWLTGDFEHSALRCRYEIIPSKRPDRPDRFSFSRLFGKHVENSNTFLQNVLGGCCVGNTLFPCKPADRNHRCSILSVVRDRLCSVLISDRETHFGD